VERMASSANGKKRSSGFMGLKLKNKVALVVGGSAGIGLAAAKLLVAAGARVFITGRQEPELDKAVAAIGGNVIAVRGDTSNLVEIDRIYKQVKEKAGRIDVLCVNARFYEDAKVGEIT
jgi:NAD(P)-dependent dehydrogenase (short-subunit alcohol dehydrogenase family)